VFCQTDPATLLVAYAVQAVSGLIESGILVSDLPQASTIGRALAQVLVVSNLDITAAIICSASANW
jgi:hypothetical protein